MKPTADKIEINQRTELYALLKDTDGKLYNRVVEFRWFDGKDKLFCEPVKAVVTRTEGFDMPVACNYIWSSPPSSKGFLKILGFGGNMSRTDWLASRCYGPRTVKVFTPDGALVAEKSIAIYPAGTTVY